MPSMEPIKEKFNEFFEQEQFLTFCYSIVVQLLLQWYKCLWGKIYNNFLRIIKHQANLALWISSFTSNLIKRLKTLKKQIEWLLSKLNKLKKLDKLIKQSSNNDFLKRERFVRLSDVQREDCLDTTNREIK